MKRTDAGFVKRAMGALIGVMAVIVFVPAVAWAQPVARVTAYEVLEALKFKGPIRHSDPQAFSLRFAEAGLLGDQVVPLQKDPLFAAATHIEAGATSNVNINPKSRKFGTGPIQGEFDLLSLQDLDGNGDPNLSDLVVIANGRLQGTLDLRPALIPNPNTGMVSPLALVSGTWNLKRDGRKPGPFSGVFLIPFDAGALGLPGNWYLNPSELEIPGLPSICRSGVKVDTPFGSFCQLSPEEYVLGFPLTKAIIFLNQ